MPSTVLVVASFAFLTQWTVEERVTFWMRSNAQHAAAAKWVQENVPANAVVFAKPATNSLWYYTDLTFVRSDYPPARANTEFFARILRAGRPIYALTYHYEQRDFKIEGGGRGTGYPDLPGTWEHIAAPWEKEIYVWKLASLASSTTETTAPAAARGF